MASQDIRDESREVPKSTTDDEGHHPSYSDATEYTPANVGEPLGRSRSKNARDDSMGSWQGNAPTRSESNHGGCSRFGREPLPSLDVCHFMADLGDNLIPAKGCSESHRHGTDDDDPYGNESLSMIGRNRSQWFQPRKPSITSRGLRDKKNHGDNPHELLAIPHPMWNRHTGGTHNL